jgi:ADP-ribose pyrophosphatase
VTGGADVLRAWDVLAEKELLKTSLFRLTRETVRLPDGRVIDDYYQIHMGAAAVVAATRTDGRLVLMRMYKHGARRGGLGFPGGGIEPGEEPIAAAQRELREETGFGGGNWASLGDYRVHSNQGCGHLFYFVATDVIPVATPTADDLEQHEFVFLTHDDVRAAIREQGFLSLGHVGLAAIWLHARS